MDVTVKSLAKKYGVSARDIIREFNDQGFDDIKDVNDVIPEDSLELMESYFNDLYDTEEIAAPKSKRGGNGKNQRSKGQEKNMPKNKSELLKAPGMKILAIREKTKTIPISI